MMRICLFPFLLIFILRHSTLASVLAASSHHLSHIGECDALLQFSNSFIFIKDASINQCDEDSSTTSYPKTASWKNGTDCCSWDGVTCHGATNYTIGLDVNCSWLRGRLHSNNSLFSLSNLRWLNLAGNDFKGSRISPRFGIFTELTHLNLSRSAFSGIIPPKISQLSSLISFDTSYNLYDDYDTDRYLEIEDHSFKWLVGNLTQLRELHVDYTDMSRVSPISLTKLPSTLSSLSLRGCKYTGPISLILGNLDHLTYLDLGYNNISDTVDFEMLAPLKNLECIYLSGNNLSMLLQSDGNCSFPKLRVLGLSGCNLTVFPYFLRSSTVMYYLDLSRNLISGRIPEWVWRVGRDTLTSLFFSSNNFTGEIPSSICQLSSLNYLDLSNNRLVGTIPGCLGKLSSLIWLVLSHNILQGPLPRSLANCTSLEIFNTSYNEIYDTFPDWLNASYSLETLDLQSNKFHGAIEISLFQLSYVILSNNNFAGQLPKDFAVNSSADFIDLANNNFEGPLPIPPRNIGFYSIANNKFNGEIPYQICSATELDVIDLSNNSLTGTIPTCFMNFFASISVLNLRANKFVGQIPEIFIPGTRLRTIRLSQNQLRGTLPRSLGYCKHLEVLDLSENELEGSFPYWLETLPNLQVLVLRSNKFSGSVDSSKTSDHPFPKLRILDLSDNRFYGPLPAKHFAKLKAMENEEKSSLRYMGDEYYQDSIVVEMKGVKIELVKILTMFTTIDFSSNFFTGEIPRVIGHLKALKGLDLSHNNLTGKIPSSMGNLTELEWLDLSSNKLNGIIPKGLADLTWLSCLNLSNNQLVGPIPQSTQFDTFDHSFDGNPRLCGHPLPKECGNDPRQTHTPALHEEEETECSNSIQWRVVLMGYGCGLSIGISTCYIMLETRRPRWLTRMVERKRARKTNGPKRNAVLGNLTWRCTRGQ
ncbi:receptor-like protein Cf-9 homolog [Punica granatum]|uniref:Receptor-like protein Cf-9 homolog n=1 Tax=Punica granatum TaxID=22663 RepID=A0A6P8BUY6_PUNGR|nr:receptor-like protein Cf-9 homolog [Punica granatum]